MRHIRHHLPMHVSLCTGRYSALAFHRCIASAHRNATRTSRRPTGCRHPGSDKVLILILFYYFLEISFVKSSGFNFCAHNPLYVILTFKFSEHI